MNTNAYMSDYMLSRYHVLMNEAREHLGGECVECGSTVALEMDHIDPSTKLFTISQGWSKDQNEFWVEVNKCQLLCRIHHRLKTTAEQMNVHGGGLSGRNKCQCVPCKARKAEYMHDRNERLKNGK